MNNGRLQALYEKYLGRSLTEAEELRFDKNRPSLSRQLEDLACVGGGGSVSESFDKRGSRGERGLRGERGPSGERGEFGLEGLSGVPGAVGKTGPRGLPGAVGERGPHGKDGADGFRGTHGPQGLTGEQGEIGESGEKGERGERGPGGEHGSVGLQGKKGEQGEQGKQGKQGERGVPGAFGKQGPIGTKGDLGPSGPKGEPGKREINVMGGGGIVVAGGPLQPNILIIRDTSGRWNRIHKDVLLAEAAKNIVKIDEADPYVYYGFATPGSVESAAVWRILREEDKGGGDSEYLYADGDDDFDNVWDDRVSLSYS